MFVTSLGLYILESLGKKFLSILFGLYRDNALVVSQSRSQQAHTLDRLSQDLSSTLGSIGLKIKIETNFTVVNFLDTTLDLCCSSYRPYSESNENLSYINTVCSLHIMSKNLVRGVSKTISNLSSNQENFDTMDTYYNVILVSSGFKDCIPYMPNPITCNKNIVRFALPFSFYVKTFVGRIFLSLVDKYFTRVRSICTAQGSALVAHPT